MAWERLRTIVEELDVSVQVDHYTGKFPRFEDMWDGLKWLLARNPEPKGSAIYVGADGRDTSYRCYAVRGSETAGTPDIWVVYTYTAHEVIILGVQAHDRADGPE